LRVSTCQWQVVWCVSVQLVSDWLLLNTKWAIFQLCHGKNKLHSMKWRCYLLCTRPTGLVGFFFIVLAQWNNSPWVDMSLHSGTLYWFLANQSLLFLLNDVSLAKKPQMPYSPLVRSERGLVPRSTARDVSMITIVF
jgi:hypothetical protein